MGDRLLRPGSLGAMLVLRDLLLARLELKMKMKPKLLSVPLPAVHAVVLLTASDAPGSQRPFMAPQGGGRREKRSSNSRPSESFPNCWKSIPQLIQNREEAILLFLAR